MKNGVFWDVTPCGSYRTDVSEELSAFIIRVTRISETGTTLAVTVRCFLITANVVSKKNGVLWDVTPCGYCKNKCFGGT
jgi:hypothetical protein